jgi:hypothetical protein
MSSIQYTCVTVSVEKPSDLDFVSLLFIDVIEKIKRMK